METDVIRSPQKVELYLYVEDQWSATVTFSDIQTSGHARIQIFTEADLSLEVFSGILRDTANAIGSESFRLADAKVGDTDERFPF